MILCDCEEAKSIRKPASMMEQKNEYCTDNLLSRTVQRGSSIDYYAQFLFNDCKLAALFARLPADKVKKVTTSLRRIDAFGQSERNQCSH